MKINRIWVNLDGHIAYQVFQGKFLARMNFDTLVLWGDRKINQL